jgi:ribose/xylose/arabinose/galactoside ABC-type transport system permease subunit
VESVVLLLAVVGAVALVYRAVRAIARLVVSLAESTAASGMAEVSARRGDVTAMEENRATERAARRRQWRDVLAVGLWVGWLLLPPMAGWAAVPYAAAAVLWLLPHSPVRFHRPA